MNAATSHSIVFREKAWPPPPDDIVKPLIYREEINVSKHIPRLIDFQEQGHQISVAIKVPTRRYMDEFIRLKCAGDLLNLKVFPDAKEITESMAAYRAAIKCLFDDFNPGDPTVACYVIGDGCTPRTAALLVFRTAWTCASIDPRLRPKLVYEGIERLLVIPLTIEDTATCFYPEKYPPPKKALIIAVHSHADLKKAVSLINSKHKAVIAIPCCVPQELDIPPTYEFDDWGIWSPERTVKVWPRI